MKIIGLESHYPSPVITKVPKGWNDDDYLLHLNSRAYDVLSRAFADAWPTLIITRDAPEFSAAYIYFDEGEDNIGEWVSIEEIAEIAKTYIADSYSNKKVIW